MYDIAKLIEVTNIEGPFHGSVPGAYVSADRAVRAMVNQWREDVGPVVEVDVGVDQPLVLEDVNLGRWKAMPFDPFVGIADGERRFGSDHDDVMSVVDQ